MRPLALVLEGFTCFKDRQVVDLEGLDLFALTGPTGAGKSSVLDAMIFALYGRVPRVGKGISELVSLGRDQLSVILEMRVAGERLRVMRKARRGKSGDAMLEAVVEGQSSPKPIASGIREVDAEITRRLGLGYDAFTQAVVLPQGQFAKFLQSEPRERRKILGDLLRLRIYEQMREDASKRRTKLDAQVTATQSVLGDEYAGVSAEAVAAARAELVVLAERAEADRTKLAAVRREAEELRALRQKTVALEAAEATLQRMTSDEGVLRDAEAKLARAQHAAPVVPRIDAADAARLRCEELERKVVAARTADVEAAAALETARARRVESDRAAEDTVRLRAELSALDEAIGKLGPLNAARDRKRRAEQDLAECADRLASATARIAQAEVDTARAREEAADREREIASSAFDAEQWARVDALRERATELAAIRVRLTTATAAERGAREVATRARDDEARSREAWEDARTAHGKLLGRVETYEDELREAERNDAAAALRRTLRAGEPCPVCAQDVAVVPPLGEAARVEELAKKRDGARREEEKARQKLDRAAKDHAAAQSAAHNALEAADRALAATKEAERDASDAERALIEAGASDVDPGEESIEARVTATSRRLLEARKRHDELARALEAARKRHDEAERQRVHEVAESAELRARSAQSGARAHEATREIESLEAEIARATGGADVVATRTATVAAIAALERARDEARRAETEAEHTRRAAEARLLESSEAARVALLDAEARRDEAERAAAEAGFESGASARAAALPRAELDELERTIDGIRRIRADAESTARALGAELAGRRVDEAQADAAADALVAAESAERESVRAHAARARDVTVIAERLDRATKLLKELDACAAERNVFARLATDLRSEKFQAFLMEEAFRDLVGGASIRLWALTERYGLEFVDDAFVVVDHDNARERRSADTLSGGETFLASLALALELSAQVQRAAGAVALDSVFIDEGFGTLDPETLDTVAGALESLPTGGRMVGIITHLPDLSARLPARVVVERSSAGSKLRVESS